MIRMMLMVSFAIGATAANLDIIFVILSAAYAYPDDSNLECTDCIRIESPLYTAYVDTEHKLCRRIDYTVKSHHLGDVGDRRGFNDYTPRPRATLEKDDYYGSGYDRGHLRAISLSAGSDHWDDVNNMAVIVPMAPEVNREKFRSLERRVEELAEFTSVNVSVVCEYDDDVQMPNADETHRVPSRFVVMIHSEGRHRVYSVSTIDNSLAVGPTEAVE